MTLEELYRALDGLPLDTVMYLAGGVGTALVALDSYTRRPTRVIKTSIDAIYEQR